MSKQAKVDVILNTEQAKAALKEVQSELKQVKTLRDKAFETGDIKGYNQLNAEYKKLTSEAGKLEKQAKDVNDIFKNLSSASVRELQNALQKANREMNSMSRNTKEWENKRAQVKLLRDELDSATGKAKQHQGSMSRLADGFNKYFNIAVAGVAALTGVFISIKQMITGNADLSDSMADVAKTSGLAQSEVTQLYKSLGKIDTRTSRKELLDLAYVAGKLGFTGQSEILGFVKAADQIGVALSKDLGGNVEEAVTSLGKLADIFKIKDQFGIEQALLKTGSAINALGASGTANEAYIVDFSKRLGGIAPQANMSIQQVMGLAATLDQLGQQTETSSTAVTQLLTKMFAKPGEFAKIAGENVGDFTKLLKTDANSALIKLLEGLNKNKGGLTELAQKFGDLNVDGSRSISVVGALANNVQMLKDAQKLSNAEFDKGTSLTAEFNLKNDNLAGNLERVGKFLRSAFVNSSINQGLGDIVAKIAEWTKTPLSETMEEERIKVNQLTGRLLEANTKLADRQKIVNELKSLAPDIVKGINAEAIAYDTLKTNLANYNNEAISRIIIQRKQQEIDATNEDVASAMGNRLKSEDELRKWMRKTAEDVASQNIKDGAALIQINNDEKKSVNEKAAAIIDYIAKANSAAGSKIYGGANHAAMVRWYGDYLNYSGQENRLLQQVNGQLTGKEKLMKELGITSDNTQDQETNTPKTGDQKLIDGILCAFDGANWTPVKITGGDPDGNKAKTAYEKLGKSIEDLTKKTQDYLKAGKEVPEAIQKELKAKIAEKKAIDDQVKAISENIGAYAKLRTEVQNLEEKILDLKAADQPVPDSLIIELASKTAELHIIENSVKGIADNIQKIRKNPLQKRDSFKDYKPGPTADTIKEEESDAQDKLDQRRDAIQSSAQSAVDFYFNYAASKDEALLNKKLSLLEKQRDAELKNKKLTESEKEAITEKYRKQEAAERTKAWKKQQKADAIQAGINTALAVTRLLAEPWAAVAAAIAGGFQVAYILSQKPPEFYSGGYTDPASDDKKPAGIVHANEFIGSAAAVRNPSVKKIFDVIDYAQRNGTISQINLPALVSTSTLKGLKVGGYTTDTTTSQSNNTQPYASSPPRMSSAEIAAMNRYSAAMESLVKNGVRGNWSLFDLEKIQSDKASLQSATEM